MPYCAHCQQEYPQGTEQCPECHRLLLPQQPVWRPYDPNEPLVVLRTVQGEIEAALLKGRLEQKGIPTLVQHESAGIVWGLTVDGLGAQRLRVPESLLRQARWILLTFARRKSWPRRRIGGWALAQKRHQA